MTSAALTSPPTQRRGRSPSRRGDRARREGAAGREVGDQPAARRRLRRRRARRGARSVHLGGEHEAERRAARPSGTAIRIVDRERIAQRRAHLAPDQRARAAASSCGAAALREHAPEDVGHRRLLDVRRARRRRAASAVERGRATSASSAGDGERRRPSALRRRAAASAPSARQRPRARSPARRVDVDAVAVGVAPPQLLRRGVGDQPAGVDERTPSRSSRPPRGSAW